MNDFLKSIGNDEMKSLAKSVVEQIGGWGEFKERAEYITKHGANNGEFGFIYYEETEGFVMRNKNEIISLIKIQSAADEYSPLEMLCNFKPLSSLSDLEIACGLFNTESEYRTQVFDCLSKYALEEVARIYIDFLESL